MSAPTSGPSRASQAMRVSAAVLNVSDHGLEADSRLGLDRQRRVA